MGYAYSARFRVVPPDGPEVTYTFTGFEPAGLPTFVEPQYAAEKMSRPTPGRKILERHFGFRPQVRFRFELIDVEDEAALAALVSSANKDGFQIYLSLDAGTTEREVLMDSAYPRLPLAGKTAGWETEIAWIATDLIESVPSILTAGGATQW